MNSTILIINFDIYIQDRAVYTCDEGYQIVGLEKVVCQVIDQCSDNPASVV